MFLQETLEVISAFVERYIPYVNEQGDYTEVRTVDSKVRFTFNNDYYVFAWIEDGELHIESETGESVFDYADCHGWTEEQVSYMKYGKKKEIGRYYVINRYHQHITLSYVKENLESNRFKSFETYDEANEYLSSRSFDDSAYGILLRTGEDEFLRISNRLR